MYRKKGAVLKGHTPRTCKKATLNSQYKEHSHSQLTLLATHGDQAATTTVRQRTLATVSPYLERVGRNSNKSGSKLLYKAVKRETPTEEYYKATETEKRLDHNPGQAKDDSRRTIGVKHNAEATPRHTPAETKVTEDRSNHERPKSHDTSTNISNLHEVGKEQPGVTTRDTEQPREKHRLTTGRATSDLHKDKGPQAEPLCTSDTPRGQGTTPYSATLDDTKERVTETTVGCLHKAPRENS
ncbi:hypothetical protein Taro_056520 [Colocasia esculenta]|uniref:Uncharacterized protein n=1 Tax=Colocasia esculenta TaxID=4460 RepID=A0A843XW04_COLES|nr:hypothetical protein [Colocasia esculenta]